MNFISLIKGKKEKKKENKNKNQTNNPESDLLVNQLNATNKRTLETYKDRQGWFTERRTSI